MDMLVRAIDKLLVLLGRKNNSRPSNQSYPQHNLKQHPKRLPPSHKYINYEHPTDQEQRTAEQYNWRWQNVMSLLTVCAAVIAVVFTYITFQQTRRQADIAEDALRDARSSAGQTISALIAAEQSAKAATDQVAIARNTEIEQLRPYVWLKLNSPPVMGSDGMVRVNRRFENTGRTAALNVQRIIEVRLLNVIPDDGAGLPYPTDQQITATQQTTFLVPSGYLNAVTVWSQPGLAELWSSVGSETGLTFVEWGTVRYEDVFGSVHHLWVCNIWRGGTGDAQKCSRGNRID